MRKDWIEGLVIFVAAFAVRIMIFYPSFIQGGDLGQFTTFAREIQAIGGVPAVNSLYFPGTEFIYPPLLFLMTYLVNAPFFSAFNATLVMHELLVIASLASSLTAVVIYYISRSSETRTKNLVVGTVAVFFMPDLYALSWGGDPFMVGEFLFISTLYLFSVRKPGKYGWVALSSVTMILLAFSHDLTWFFSMFAFLILLVYDLVKKNNRILVMELVPFVISLVAGMIWWVPRLAFLYHAFFITEAAGYGLYTPIGAVFNYVLVFIPFAVAVGILAFYSLFRSNIVLTKVKWDPFIVALVASAVFIVFMFKSETLGSRIMYFSIIFVTIVVLGFFRDSTGPHFRKSRSTKGRKIAGSTAALVIMLIIMLTVPFQVAFAVNSVDHYKSGYYQYDQELLDWGQTHFVNGTVVAPNVGNYIASVDGAPVIIYGNFLVGASQIKYRNAAASIILNPGNQTSVNYINQYGIRYIVISTSFADNLSLNNHFPPAMYRTIFSDKYYYVEEYIGH